MTMFEAIRSCLRNFANFSGRASRSEFWYWMLANSLINIVFGAIDQHLNPGSQFTAFSAVTAFVMLALALPCIAVTVRRLHDVAMSGWWTLLYLTVVGLIPLLYWHCVRGTNGKNRFGSDPLMKSERPRIRIRVAFA